MKNRNCNCVVFLCDTYMQLITAIQIKLNLLRTIEADILVTDHSKNAEEIAVRLEHTGLFRRIKLVKTRFYTYDQNILADIKDVLALIRGDFEKYRDFIWKENVAYDAIFYHNISIISYLIYDLSKREKNKPICIRFEEGLASYPAMKRYNGGKRLKAYRFYRLLCRKGDIFDDTKIYMCYCPELFMTGTDENCYTIPYLEKENKELCNLLNYIFEYIPKVCDQKYIYFSSSADIDGRNIEEKRIVKEIVEKVGKDNIIIKVHPRDPGNIYQEMGLSIWDGVEFPWEIAQLNCDFSDKIFISLSSGSILNASVMFNEDIKSYYLYLCVKGKDHCYDSYCKELGEMVHRLQEKGYCKKHRVLTNVGELNLDDKDD